ncbi:MAG: phosphoribosylamine--glycine ligase, partial [Alphaproteobacteria bacterium]|nr:phosphoribosylamine--glycine ligase [Alphaproteobacteria bacterium]
SADDALAVIEMCRTRHIGFVVVGPEAPLVAGMVDALEEAGIPAFGPSAKAAMLEASKGFTRDLCASHHIPSVGYVRATTMAEARAYTSANTLPLVVKADGLAAGKGVSIGSTEDEANSAAEFILSGGFPEAGTSVVIEQFLEGEEVSFFALVDGKHVLPLGSAQDHKAVGDGDTGPNTGGMGAYSPAPVMTDALEAQIMDTIIRPTVAAMEAEGRPFKGVLFAGLMITRQGPKLLEYNVRFGDPECQVLMARLDCDLLPLLKAARDGTLDQVRPKWRDDAALCVVMAAKGYPGAYEKGSVINGLEAAQEDPDVTIFHAGTTRASDQIQATGGRVLGVTATGASVGDAQSLAYRAVEKIDWPNGFYRRDIGWRAIDRKP